MSLPLYEQYKSTGIASLGSVPAHWRVTRLKQMATIQNGRDYKDVETDTGGYPVFGSGGEFARATDYLHNGESVLLGRKGTIDRPLYINGPFWTADTMFYTVINIDTSAKYLYYCALTIRFDLYSTNTALPSMTQADLGGIHFAAPCLAEQEAIVAFLDRETAKIDALISVQERLITLLVEKRQATISHAVTKGLNPNVPMEDSGVEWLGTVPEHWRVVPLKYLVTLESGGTPSKENLDYWGGDIPWASSKDLKSEQLADTIDHITKFAIESRAASLIPVRSVMVVVRGMILARIFPVVENLVPMAINQDLKAIRSRPDMCNSFLAWLLRGSASESLRRLDEAGHGTKALRMETWTSMKLPVPPLNEQSAIVEFLCRETSSLDTLSVEAKRGIALLQERRSALIYAAVTGKIDVRPAAQQEQSTTLEAA